MQLSSTMRSVVVYGLVGLALLGAIILGIQVAKNRSSIVSNSDSSKPAVAQQPATQQPTSNDQQNQQNSDQPKTDNPANNETPPPIPAPTDSSDSNTSTTGSTSGPSRVPATGGTDLLIMPLALAGLVFAASVYVQSRRRLYTF